MLEEFAYLEQNDKFIYWNRSFGVIVLLKKKICRFVEGIFWRSWHYNSLIERDYVHTIQKVYFFCGKRCNIVACKVSTTTSNLFFCDFCCEKNSCVLRLQENRVSILLTKRDRTALSMAWASKMDVIARHNLYINIKNLKLESGSGNL